jgi:hypothetical protein
MPTKKDEEEMTEAEFEAELVKLMTGLLKESKNIASRVFATINPSNEMSIGCHKRVFAYDDEDDQEMVAEELAQSFRVAQQVFNIATPSAEEVFWVYDEAFDDDSEDEDEDEDDDD